MAGNPAVRDWNYTNRELTYTKGLVETLRTRIVKSEQEVLKLKIRVKRLETKVGELEKK